MPTTQEFTLIVDQNTILFITLIVRLFLGLVMCLAFAFSFVIAVLYCAGKLLCCAYTLMFMVVAKMSHKKAIIS
ncbi:MAG: hypothetical protein ACRDHW_10705 [Ktedonobacteraceae bacterium]